MQNVALIVAVVAAACLVVYVAYRFIELRANLKFERWKQDETTRISRDAIRGSQSAVAGRVAEQLAPFLPGFGFNPKDARFIGNPIDFVVFDGLSDGDLRRVVFVEVKTGGGVLNANERKVRAVIQERRVEWLDLKIAGAQPPLPARGTP